MFTDPFTLPAQSGAILGRRFQSYEAHIPYLLQVMVDYNLVGMAHIHFSRALFRGPLPIRPLSKNRPRFGHRDEAQISPVAQKGPVEVELGASVKKPGRRRHRCSLDGASIKIEYEPETPEADGQGEWSSPASSPGAQESPLYVRGNVAADWIWGAGAGVSQARGQLRVPSKYSCCELEADATVEGEDADASFWSSTFRVVGPKIRGKSGGS